MDRSLGGSLTELPGTPNNSGGSSGGGGGGRSASDMERIKQAKKKRAQQLKQFAQYDKQMEKEAAKKLRKGDMDKQDGRKKRNVVFDTSIILLEAAGRDDVAEVQKLLTEGVSPDTANSDGLTALHQCCIDNSPLMCQLLLKFGANVNSRDSELWTPLHAAATCGHVQICILLIENGADLLAVNADGNMPYDICEDDHTLDYIENEMAKRNISQEQIDDTRCIPERNMLSDMIRLSREKKDRLNEKNSQGATPLHIAAACGYLNVAQFLIDKRVILTAIDNDGWQAIHIASCWGHPDIIQLLVATGIDIEAKTRNGETIFDICEDGELHDRLLEIKKEAELHKMTSKPGLVRRKSSNNPRSADTHVLGSITRTASIRRSSMREKSMMSWKEAKLEAEMRAKSQEAQPTIEEAPTSEVMKSTLLPVPEVTNPPLSPNQVRVSVDSSPQNPHAPINPRSPPANRDSPVARPPSNGGYPSPRPSVNGANPNNQPPLSPPGGLAQQQKPRPTSGRPKPGPVNTYNPPPQPVNNNATLSPKLQVNGTGTLSARQPPVHQRLPPEALATIGGQPPPPQPARQMIPARSKEAIDQASKSGKCCVVM